MAPGSIRAADLASRLSGKILLQVEENGEAWYVNPGDNLRYYMGRPTDAFNLMRELGLGIKHEELLGYLNSNFPVRLSGKIMLDVEANGEAYYVYPGDLKGYFLNRPADAFSVMRNLGLGITNENLNNIAPDRIEAGSGITSEPDNKTEDADNAANSSIGGLEREIDGIIAGDMIVGPDHYARIVRDINNLENKGINVSVLEEKLIFVTVAGQTDSQTDNTDNSEAEAAWEESNIMDMLPECADQKYTVFPVEFSDFYAISPLGGIGPPGHTIPNEHIHIHISPGQTSTKVVPLKSPGNIYITSVISSPNGYDPARREYWINFSLCKNIHGYFNHVKELSLDLNNTLDAVDCADWSDNPGDLCSKKIFKEISAGTVIGGVGYIQGNFDFGALNHTRRLDFQNLSRYGSDNGGYTRPRTPYIDCALDYYDDGPIKDQAIAKLDRLADPRCGVTMLDIKGTLQGNWFIDDIDIASEWDKQLAFLLDPIDPAVSVVSIGGVFTQFGKWEFTANSSGFFNREFREVTPDNNIYCYSADGKSGKIIVALTSDTELKIEHQDGICGGSYAFQNPFTYNR